MKFWIMLLILGWRMSWLSRHNEGFQKQLDGKDFVLQFRTIDGGVGRHYQVSNGSVTAFPGVHQQPSMTLSFKDSAYAFETIMAAGKDPAVFMKGMQAQDIKTDGDVSLMMWFMGISKYLPPKKKKKKT
ncbi:hypothetical protein A9Q81_03050 [Gammaproteobacteria bacterium 42_54_T18]|nr:hypothetical protein A9Q81_03050 [Gammaproteobacteria bacterium 42_54_T18]